MCLNFISIESATKVCSVSAYKASKLMAIEESEIENSHSTNITNFVDCVLKKSSMRYEDLNVIGISEGPGSYTGLRIGASVAKALSYTLNIPLIAYNTLEAIVSGVVQKHQQKSSYYYGAAIDARRDEVYIAIYNKYMQEVLSPTNLELQKKCLSNILNGKKLIISGDGGEKVKNITENSSIIYDHFIKCSSKFSIDLIIQKYSQNHFRDTTYFEPNYIKPFFTFKKPK